MADENVIIEENEQNVGEYDPNPYDNVTVEEALKQLYNRFTPRTVRQAIFTMAENNKPATLVEKSITENGEYVASADNADGYSKVTVDVDIENSFKIIRTVTDKSIWYLINNNTEAETIRGEGPSSESETFLNPVSKINCGYAAGETIVFTPAENYSGFYIHSSGRKIEFTGSAEPTTNDGYLYIATLNFIAGTYALNKMGAFPQNSFVVVE